MKESETLLEAFRAVKRQRTARKLIEPDTGPTNHYQTPPIRRGVFYTINTDSMIEKCRGVPEWRVKVPSMGNASKAAAGYKGVLYATFASLPAAKTYANSLRNPTPPPEATGMDVSLPAKKKRRVDDRKNRKRPYKPRGKKAVIEESLEESFESVVQDDTEIFETLLANTPIHALDIPAQSNTLVTPDMLCNETLEELSDSDDELVDELVESNDESQKRTMPPLCLPDAMMTTMVDNSADCNEFEFDITSQEMYDVGNMYEQLPLFKALEALPFARLVSNVSIPHRSEKSRKMVIRHSRSGNLASPFLQNRISMRIGAPKPMTEEEIRDARNLKRKNNLLAKMRRKAEFFRRSQFATPPPAQQLPKQLPKQPPKQPKKQIKKKPKRQPDRQLKKQPTSPPQVAPDSTPPAKNKHRALARAPAPALATAPARPAALFSKYSLKTLDAAATRRQLQGSCRVCTLSYLF